MPVSIERISGDEQQAELRVVDEDGREVTLAWSADDAPSVTTGPRWLLTDLLRRHGGRALRRALEDAARYGVASL